MCHWQRLQVLWVNGFATSRTIAIRAIIDTYQGGLNLFHLPPTVLIQGDHGTVDSLSLRVVRAFDITLCPHVLSLCFKTKYAAVCPYS
jgi:hypothetical protein